MMAIDELFQIWVSSPHNANGYFTIYGDDSLHHEHFDSQLSTGDIHTSYARTGFLGFIRRTELTQSDGGRLTIARIYLNDSGLCIGKNERKV